MYMLIRSRQTQEPVAIIDVPAMDVTTYYKEADFVSYQHERLTNAEAQTHIAFESIPFERFWRRYLI